GAVDNQRHFSLDLEGVVSGEVEAGDVVCLFDADRSDGGPAEGRKRGTENGRFDWRKLGVEVGGDPAGILVHTVGSIFAPNAPIGSQPGPSLSGRDVAEDARIADVDRIRFDTGAGDTSLVIGISRIIRTIERVVTVNSGVP